MDLTQQSLRVGVSNEEFRHHHIGQSSLVTTADEMASLILATRSIDNYEHCLDVCRTGRRRKAHATSGIVVHALMGLIARSRLLVVLRKGKVSPGQCRCEYTNAMKSTSQVSLLSVLETRTSKALWWPDSKGDKTASLGSGHCVGGRISLLLP